jgi:flagellar biosynthesis protein FlhG
MNHQPSNLNFLTGTAKKLSEIQILPSLQNKEKAETKTRCIAITGGKGGIGKTNLAVNLAFELGSLGSRVSLLDADFGLANIDLLCGISPKFHLGHVISSMKDLEDIRIDLNNEVSLIPGGSGVEELAKLSIYSHPHFFEKLRIMAEDVDFMLMDTAAGIAENVISVLVSASEVIIIATPEPASIIDSYATIKTLLRYAPSKPISIVVNNVVEMGDAEQVFDSLNSAVQNFLGQKADFLGMIPYDPQVPKAVRQQIPFVHFAPDAPASRAVRLIAEQLFIQKQTGSQKVESFWNTLTKG